MELVLTECAFKSLTIFEVLGTLAVEHAVGPVALVLLLVILAIQDSEARLDSILEVTLISAAIAPPEDASAVSLASFELSLVCVGILS